MDKVKLTIGSVSELKYVRFVQLQISFWTLKKKENTCFTVDNNEYEKYVQTLTLKELIDVKKNIDQNNYPDRYSIVLRRLEETVHGPSVRNSISKNIGLFGPFHTLKKNKAIQKKVLFSQLVLMIIAAPFLITAIKNRSTDHEGDFYQLVMNGQVCEGTVIKSEYSIYAPSGWGVSYKFSPIDEPDRVYHGVSKGPCERFFPLKPGDQIDIIFDIKNPANNSELYNFHCDPNHLHYAEEQNILSEYQDMRNEYGADDYSYLQWYDKMREDCAN